MELNSIITHLASNAPGFARRLKEAGLSPDLIHSPDDLNGLPVVRKEELVELQAANPPFGGFLACEPGELNRIFQSPTPNRARAITGAGSLPCKLLVSSPETWS